MATLTPWSPASRAALAPVGDRLLLPLPVQHVEEFGRPRAWSPSWDGCASSESPGQPENVTTTGTCSCSASRTVCRNTSSACAATAAVGMQRVAVTRQRADRQPRVLDHRAGSRGRARACRAGPSRSRWSCPGQPPVPSSIALHVPQRAHFRQHRSDVQAAEDRRKHASFIECSSTNCGGAATVRPRTALAVALEHGVHDARRAIAVFECGHGGGARAVDRRRAVERSRRRRRAARCRMRRATPPGVRRASAHRHARAASSSAGILRHDRVRARGAARSTARSAAPAATAASPRRRSPRTSKSFLWPAHTWPTETQPLAPPSNRSSTLARSSLRTV